MKVQPVTLKGEHVRLEPLSLDHLTALCEVGLEPELWRWSPTKLSSCEDLETYVRTALRERDEGVSQPFVIVASAVDRVVGSSRFGNIDLRNRRVEIGWTWIGVPWQRTAVNTETKYLMLRHAFEDLGCIRVEFKTDSLNERSQQALLRIGAREEGTFRNHMMVHDGRYRHSVYFSIIESEWPEVKSKLETRLKKGSGVA